MSIVQDFVTKSDQFFKKENLPDVQVGDTVKLQLFLELPKSSENDKNKERIQAYEGVVIAKSGNNKFIGSTITVRKVFQGLGIEKVFFLNSPWIKTIEILKSAKVRRGKLYYLRNRTGKSARLKRKF
jgi:large subunit ribosomal protein L19